jgi:hypothetical protein
MALATRAKPTTHHKKRQAKHHRRNKSYVKAYWPYLPMLAIGGVGYLANQHWPAGLVKLDASTQPTTRIEALSGTQNTWSLTVIIMMSAIAAAIFLFQHWFRVQRLINRGERFIIKHPWFDISLVLIATAGLVLTRRA